jgi:excisionase family DNA binding protein
MQNATEFLTVDEAAQLAGLSHWTIRRWLDSGRLTRYRAASRVVVSRAELLELVKPKKSEDSQCRP